jgi:hypothetical protein
MTKTTTKDRGKSDRECSFPPIEEAEPELIQLMAVIRTIPDDDLPMALDCFESILRERPEGILPLWSSETPPAAYHVDRLFHAFQGAPAAYCLDLMNALRRAVASRVEALGGDSAGIAEMQQDSVEQADGRWVPLRLRPGTRVFDLRRGPVPVGQKPPVRRIP